jgi:hypothetical protein
MLNSLMSEATAHGRRRNFFVLDLSAAASRVGNACNILEDETDPSACAELFLSDNYRPMAGDWLDAHRFLTECARRILRRGFSVDAEGMALELRSLATDHETMDAWRELYGNNYPARTDGLANYLATYVERFASKHRRFFDRTSPWPGLASAFVRPQILVIFVSTRPDGFESMLQTIAFNAIRKAIKAATKKAAPDMLLLNDVDILGNGYDVTEQATVSRVCIALADQCPTLPFQFDDAAVEFRSVFYKEENGSGHYLLEDGRERHVWAGRRHAWQDVKKTKPSNTVIRDGVLVRKT